MISFLSFLQAQHLVVHIKQYSARNKRVCYLKFPLTIHHFEINNAVSLFLWLNNKALGYLYILLTILKKAINLQDI